MPKVAKTRDAEILSELKARGMRMTIVRQLVIRAMLKSNHPVSVALLIETLAKQGKRVNKTTVYREVQALLEAKVIREVNLLDGYLRYELNLNSGHHHHIVCTKCNDIQCVQMDHDLDQIEKRIKRQHGFQVTDHVLEFFGCCASCCS